MSHNLKPKEKAQDLVNKFISFCTFNDEGLVVPVALKASIACVDELIEEHNFNSKISWNVKQIKYWEAVKSELLNYKTG
jgi:hypothetical protein